MPSMVATTRAVFDRQLNNLRQGTMQLSQMVIDQVVNATSALQQHDLVLAHQVDKFDANVNKLRLELEEQCYTLMALQQPNSSDMRFIMATVSLVTNLERMGDHAAGIARLTIRMEGKPCRVDVPEFDVMTQKAVSHLRSALDSFETKNEKLARDIVARDVEIDQLHKQVYSRLLQSMIEAPETIECATMMLWMSHNLERYADRISNICERVVYYITGELWEYHVEPNIPETVTT
jgi:phosphate transport system protein